jgi:hypothetical protein
MLKAKFLNQTMLSVLHSGGTELEQEVVNDIDSFSSDKHNNSLTDGLLTMMRNILPFQ